MVSGHQQRCSSDAGHDEVDGLNESKEKEKDVASPQEENKLDFAIFKEEKTNLNCSRPPTKER